MVGETSRIAEWAKGFDKLLEDPDGVACFQEFLKKEYADENIKFWLACKKYEGMTDPKKVRTRLWSLVLGFSGFTGFIGF